MNPNHLMLFPRNGPITFTGASLARSRVLLRARLRWSFYPNGVPVRLSPDPSRHGIGGSDFAFVVGLKPKHALILSERPGPPTVSPFHHRESPTAKPFKFSTHHPSK